MNIHVVKPGDTIASIAREHGVSEHSLITNNHIDCGCDLTLGESLVIVYPELTYRIQEGDTLYQIAETFGVTPMQLLMNNPSLLRQSHIYPGDLLIIEYPKKDSIVTHGNAFTFIDKDILKKSLPYLTYLSVVNYTITDNGTIESYYDDLSIISLCEEYRVIPLMLLSTFTLRGKTNIGIEYELLLNPQLQNKVIENLLGIIKTHRFLGVNMSFQFITLTTLDLYESFVNTLSNRIREEGYLFFVSLTPLADSSHCECEFEDIDYSKICEMADKVIFLQYYWSQIDTPPSPIMSVSITDRFLEYALKTIPPDKIIIGIPTMGYSWELPYSTKLSDVNFLTHKAIMDLTKIYNLNLQFDAESLTPFIEYEVESNQQKIHRIIWFIDARTISALLDLVVKYNLSGVDIWNLSIYNPHLWLILNAEFHIIKE